MMSSPFRAAWLGAALLSTALLAACSGSDTLGPPDGTACTVGSIASGDSVNGVVNSASCEVFDPWSYELTSAESWTLGVKKGTAYIIRLRHQQDASANDNWAGDLEAFGRNAQGDVSFVTGWYGPFGTNNGNGGQNQEMYLAADEDRTLSIRVVSSTKADTGAYSLAVSTCPITQIADTVSRADIDLSTGCPALAYGGWSTKLMFFSFQADSAVRDTANVTRTSGTGTFLARLSGTGIDVNCWNRACGSTNSGWTTGTTLTRVSALPGTMTLLVGVRADSAATVTVNTRPTPPAAVTAPAFAPTARIVGRNHGSR